jgi:hypothetical protein
MEKQTKKEKEKAIKYENIIVNFANYDFQDFIETLVEMAVHKDEVPLSYTGVDKATQDIWESNKITPEEIFKNFKKLLEQERVNDFLKYQKFFKIKDTQIKNELRQEIIKTFISLSKKEDLMHAFDIKHLISDKDFDTLVSQDLKETIQKKIEKYIKTGEINFFEKIINIFQLKEKEYINDQNKEIVLQGIESCLSNKNIENFQKIQEKFKISSQEIFQKTKVEEIAMNILSEYLEKGAHKEFKKTLAIFDFKKQDIIYDKKLRTAALKGIDKNLKSNYNSTEAVLIKEFFDFSLNDLNTNIDRYIQDPENEKAKVQKLIKED